MNSSEGEVEENFSPMSHNDSMMQTPLVVLVNKILSTADTLMVLRKNPPAPSNVNGLNKAMQLERKYIDLRNQFIQMTSTGVLGQGNAEYATRAFAHEANTTFKKAMGRSRKARKTRKMRR